MSEAEGSESFIERQRHELAALKVRFIIFNSIIFIIIFIIIIIN